MKILIMAIYILLLASCNNGPKRIESSDNTKKSQLENTGIFSSSSGSEYSNDSEDFAFGSELHKVKVLEVLPTDKYVYLRVNENTGEEFWIATRKQEVVTGATYFYRGGLLKTNFESKEYNRIFDKVYLVSNIVPESHAQNQSTSSIFKNEDASSDSKRKLDGVNHNLNSGNASLPIADLVKNRTKYEGQQVVLTGTVTKVNPNIMGRNWIHLKDGTLDDYDLVLTSSVAVPEGHTVSLKGIVSLNKDFGAGYTYDILVENAELVR